MTGLMGHFRVSGTGDSLPRLRSLDAGVCHGVLIRTVFVGPEQNNLVGFEMQSALHFLIYE